MKQLQLVAFFLISYTSFSQVPFANLIKVKTGLTFSQVANLVLDKGYLIEKKDNDLQTISTEWKEYEKGFNAGYRMVLRQRDSVVYLTVYFTAPFKRSLFFNTDKNERPLFENERAYGYNRKGKAVLNALQTVPFWEADKIAKELGSEINHTKE